MTDVQNTYKKPSISIEETLEEIKPIPKPQKPSFKNIFKDRRFALVCGFGLLFFSFYLLIAFVSYLFTGKADQSLVEAYSSTGVREAGEEVENWLGVYGAVLSYKFIYKWFGLGAFLLIPILFVYAVRLILKMDLFPVRRFTQFAAFAIFWLSILLGYVISSLKEDSYFSLIGGSLGYEIASFFKALLGFGALLLIILLAVIFIIYFYNITSIDAQILKTKAQKEKEDEAKIKIEKQQQQELLAKIQAEKELKPITSIPVKKTFTTDNQEDKKPFEPYEMQITSNKDKLKNNTNGQENNPFFFEDNSAKHNLIDGITLIDVRTRREILPENENLHNEIIERIAETPILEEVEDDQTITSRLDLEQLAEIKDPYNTTNDGFDINSEENLLNITSNIVPNIPVAISENAKKSAKENIKTSKDIPFVVEKPVAADDNNNDLDNLEENLLEENLEDIEIIASKNNNTNNDDTAYLASLSPYNPREDLSRYQFPAPELLNEVFETKIQVSDEELQANKDRIVDTLGNYGIGIDSIKATIGPTVTLYEIIPMAGVRISKIKNLEDDIALTLAALGIRIIAPMPGKGTIGIEVPNKKREMVPMRALLASEKFKNCEYDLPIVFGKTVTNDIFIVDLAKMPHLLVAGATGQGKSVGLNVILASLLYKKHPAELKFVLIDPKKVELNIFAKIERHFLAKLPDEEDAIITDTSKVINTLNSLCIEMDTRYDLLKAANCRNIKEYNQKFINRKLNPKKGNRFLPYIVLVIDELADLMVTAGKEVELPISRLAQLARAIGIHLIVATQRPSVNVVTGLIKANFPARLSFRVSSKIDSRTILDAGGAEQLVGMGDMLYSSGNDLTRLQCAFLDTPEVENICDFIGEQNGYSSAYLLPEVVGEAGTNATNNVDLSDKDALFEDAARIIVMHQQGSTSLLQRRLKLGYNRAGRLIDQLEKAGIVGQFEGSKAREVLVTDEIALEKLLKTL